jgi:hypothetical protein
LRRVLARLHHSVEALAVSLRGADTIKNLYER